MAERLACWRVGQYPLAGCRVVLCTALVLPAVPASQIQRYTGHCRLSWVTESAECCPQVQQHHSSASNLPCSSIACRARQTAPQRTLECAQVLNNY